MESLKVKATGIAPLIMHNNQCVDPRNYYAKLIKEISSKRAKTEADLDRLAELEFFAGLYLYNDAVVLPTRMLLAAFISGAKKIKAGPVAKAGCFFSNHATLEYEGSKVIEELWKDSTHVLTSVVKIGTASVLRTRPIFETWSVDIEMLYDPEIINKQTVMTAWDKAGQLCGFGDWRPQFGRFAVEMVK